MPFCCHTFCCCHSTTSTLYKGFSSNVWQCGSIFSKFKIISDKRLFSYNKYALFSNTLVLLFTPNDVKVVEHGSAFATGTGVLDMDTSEGIGIDLGTKMDLVRKVGIGGFGCCGRNVG